MTMSVVGKMGGNHSNQPITFIPPNYPESSNFVQVHQIIYVNIVQCWYFTTNIQWHECYFTLHEYPVDVI